MLAGLAAAPAVEAAPCGTPGNNEIVVENCKPGSPASEWDVSGAGDPGIQGFATSIGVPQGETVHFKVDTSATDYRLDIYRMGYYGGSGARLVATVQPSAALPQSQPACRDDAGTGLIDCGDWSESASWHVPAGATSGIYLAKLVREGGVEGASHIVFVVRDDNGASDLLFQTSDTTWQAYNAYGGNSLYTGSPDGRAYKVSYNRPFITRESAPEGWVFNSEYPMVRWLERNGYDVSYSTGADSDRFGAELREHAAFLSVGHDEYWSGTQRANVAAARDAGVSLGFFSGNESFWKTRWEDAHRTLVSYKETHANAKIDPLPDVWTGTWRDPRPFNPAGPQPENALTGTIFTVNAGSAPIQVPAADGRLRFWRGTDVAAQAPGAVATLTADTIGYEWDEDLDNGARPAGLVRLSSSTVDGVQKLQDYGSTYAPGTATHHLTLYRDSNGAGRDALVFGAGTIQWPWGLDGEHDRGGSDPSAAMQQATVNVLADMNSRPTSLQAGLAPAAATTDATPPTSTITAPGAGATLAQGAPVTIRGTAADRGGRVGAVEVSVDDGASWHPADGREMWSYAWTPNRAGVITLRSRAADDSGNLETGPVPGPVPAPGAGRLPAGPAARARPRVRVGPRRVRMSRSGRVSLRVACPVRARSCRVALRIRFGGRQVAARTLTVRGGKTRVVVLKLRRSARRALARKRSIRVVAIAAARNPAGDRATTRTSIRLLPPRAGSRKRVSGRASAASGGVPVIVAPRACPCTLFEARLPGDTAANDGVPIEVGVRFRADTDGAVTGLRYYKGPTWTGTRVGHLWSEDGRLLATADFTGESASGWQQATLSSPVRVVAGATYIASYASSDNSYSSEDSFFTAPFDAGPLHAPAVANGVYRYGGGFPTETFAATNYWADVVFVPSAAQPPRDVAPAVTAVHPRVGAEPAITDRAPPRVRVTPRRTRSSRRGVAKLRVACPAGELRCRVTLRLRLAGHAIATRTLTVPGGRTRTFALVLSRSARLELARERSLRVTAIAAARDLAGNRATTRSPIRLLAPRAGR